jgi:glycosyltransferase involved in cell wall biosynthesis
MKAELDIVIPVYNEGRNIIPVLDSLAAGVKTPFRVLICYDRDDDDTLTALADYKKCSVAFIKNRGKGALGAVLSGFEAADAAAVLMMPADDDYNAPIIDPMMEQFRAGCDIVCPSRFMRGGCMVGCPPVKATLVRTAAFVLKYLLRLPTHDPTNGFRLFSKRLLNDLPVETEAGFAYSLELLAKADRLGLKVAEVPARWFERKAGKSRFKVFKWAPIYMEWVNYVLATRLLRRGPQTVKHRQPGDTPHQLSPQPKS